MSLTTDTIRGLTRYLPGAGRKEGAAVQRLVIFPATTTPVYGSHIRPTSAPSGTAAAGDLYFDTTNNALYSYNGSAFEPVGSNLVDLDVSGDLTVGDDLTMGSTGAILQMGPTATNPITLTQSANTLTLGTGDTFVADDITINDDLTLNSSGAIVSIGDGANAVTLTHSANTLTVGASDTLAVTTADLLTVGGLIVPQHFYLAFRILPHASATEYDLWTAPEACEVTRIDVTPSILQGGALTATIVKAADTATPANGTTPMHTANAIDLNAGAYTVQTITLTVTTADLQLAAGDHIGIDFSAALTTGMADVAITLKRI